MTGGIADGARAGRPITVRVALARFGRTVALRAGVALALGVPVAVVAAQAAGQVQAAADQAPSAGRIAVPVAAPIGLQQVAPDTGHYVHVGLVATASKSNGGDISNLGFVVGQRCVAVIDTGNAPSIALGLREAIRQVTALPVCFVVLTHMHPDHVLGASVWKPPSPGAAPIIAHERLAPALSARSQAYSEGLVRELGDAAAGVRIVYPDDVVRDGRTLDLGGRALELKAWPTAHTDNDLTVLDRSAGVLWLGDLAFESHLPVVDGSLRGWLSVIDELVKIPARHVVPGHGTVRHDPSGGTGAAAAALAAERAYLERLRDRVRAAIANDVSLAQAATSLDDVARPPAGAADAPGWKLVDDFHRRNVSAAYAELEWE